MRPPAPIGGDGSSRFLRHYEFLMRDDSRFFGLDWIVKAENLPQDHGVQVSP